MKKYRVRDYTMEQKGFIHHEYTSELFDTYEDALREILQREATDRNLGIHDEYYVEEVEI